MPENLTYIDLFAGCGGLSLGLHLAGWKGLLAVEKNKDAFSTLKHNLIENKKHFYWPDWLPVKNHDINSLLKSYKENLISLQGNVTLVAGGPPCQGFSTAGARNEKDKRNDLVDSYMRFIELVKPKLIFFENVKVFTFEFKKKNKEGKTYSEKVISELKDLGYDVHYKIINFSEYGVPQSRNRFILIGMKDGKAEKFFDLIENNKKQFFEMKEIDSYNTLGNAISDLVFANGVSDCPDTPRFKSGFYSEKNNAYQEYMRGDDFRKGQIPDSHRFANHKKESVDLFEKILSKAERNKRVSNDLKKKFEVKKRSIAPLAENLPCPVLTSHPDDYIHYSEPRILTVREYARIQSFPDWYEFKGKYTTGGKARKKEVPRYTQLGNAIPPLFAEQTGLALKQLLL